MFERSELDTCSELTLTRAHIGEKQLNRPEGWHGTSQPAVTGSNLIAGIKLNPENISFR